MATHLHITGIVQGVGYRASFDAEARRLNLSGWVRNRRDGSVEALVDGPAEAIENIIAWSRRGPSLARVTDVHVSVVDSPPPHPGRFEVLPTA
ncbi:acylphosphatase [Noviherbaspirillum sp. Root189]|uniref:acylphosphatase n=1 Tax=Noviherbaspirillum sp. Root189 TaxID=1736487 RepID=UPI00070AA1DB|nr:acylphosphatase [Noviherbaspirillum sp. Root189]KRB92717.1 acylphosphatase [Noviherbaspirillum sp. Root189]